jgi:hypothetical protein
MAGSSNDDQNCDRSKRCAADNDNPFVTFRRFADQQVNSFVNTIFSLPSAFNSSFTERRKCSWKDENRRYGPDAHRYGEPDDEHDDEFGPFERMFRDLEAAVEKEAKEFEKILKNSNSGKTKKNPGQSQPQEPKVYYWSWSWPPKSAEESGQEREEFHKEMTPGAERCKRRRDYSDLSGPFGRPRGMCRRNKDLYRQWEDYLLHDAYSPLQLEKSESLGTSTANWRYAYEDLLSETAQSASAFPIGRLYYTSDHDRSMLSPHQWIRHLQTRHDSMWWSTSSPRFSLFKELNPADAEVPQIQQELESRRIGDVDRKQTTRSNDSLGQSAEKQPYTTSDPDSEPQSELDMYKQFLGSASQSTSAPSGSRPSILSTLATTERTVQADGTITTKVILKKRFADGREESSETVHTSKADNSQLTDIQNGILTADDKLRDHPKEEPAKRGWFWSS